MLSDARFHVIGQTPYDHEQEAIAFAREALPDRNPFQAWALFELPDPSTGGLYEIDLLVLGYGALYLVEIKSGPGTYEGDARDWWRKPPGAQRPRYMKHPFPLANHKAKVLKSRLERQMRGSKHRCPYVHAVVFLSAEDTRLQLRDGGHQHVLRRDTFAAAFTHHQYPGANERFAQRVDKPTMREVAIALKKIGVRAREGKIHAGSYELGPLLAEGDYYQEREAQHRITESIKRRARTYLVPQQTSVERRQQLARAADREATLLEHVKEHPGVLSVNDYVVDAPLGPTVLFEAFEDGVPLGAFLEHEALSFAERLELIEGMGRALAHCHRREVFHGGLSPDAVLVRRNEGRLDTRLCNFQLGGSGDVPATSHWSQLASQPWVLYQAPELHQDPSLRGVLSDMFSYGALAYLVLTGRPPATDLSNLLERLQRDQWLDPAAVSDDLLEPVADFVRDLTRLAPLDRPDEVDSWLDLLFEQLTDPDADEAPPGIDPVEARKGDLLGDLEVEGVLGHGATARVLLVRAGGRQLALKVPLGDGHEERFEREAEVLGQLRHPRVVELIEKRRIGGRVCLLMTVAGEHTLQRHLAQEGSLSVDLACRYGEDLLQALEYLEECQVLHRDIKPANLGVGATGKQRKHLTLFDFSLAYGTTSAVDVGTPVYRDPFLHERDGWDFHAERWGAAVTLHEMLTGVRPQWGDQARPALAADARLRLAAERFDSALRDRLIGFFERALAREASERFASTDAMRAAWLDVFKAVTFAADGDSEAPPASEPSVADLAAIELDTAIAALPLSARARNALDRAGLVKGSELLGLPANRLQAVRGVGRKVADEIVAFRARWQEARDEAQAEADAAATPFHPHYRGPHFMVHTADLDAALAAALVDAGLHTLGAVAAAPRPQVTQLCKRVGIPVKTLRSRLKAEQERLERAAEQPETVGDWLASLLPERRKAGEYARGVLGLTAPFAGRLDVAVKEVAEHHGRTTANLYIALGKLRTEWMGRDDLMPIRAACRELVEAAGGAVPLQRLGLQLRAHLGDDLGDRDPLVRAQGAALARIAVESQEDALELVRLRESEPWILASPRLTAPVRRLGEAADRLARREVLASPGEVARELTAAVEGTELADLSGERRLELAAAASKDAAPSARLELYPRGMPAERALELCASVLSHRISPLVVVTRVSSRYPHAEPLPPRPALDALLEPHGLRFDPQQERYVRAGRAAASTHGTELSSLTVGPASVPTSRPRMSEREMAAHDFAERIRDAVQRRSLRLLGVNGTRAERAALQLVDAFGLELVSLDALLLDKMNAVMKAKGVEPFAVYGADREGPSGEAWPLLVELMRAAADEAAAELFPVREATLLVQPGLLARYRLDGFVRAMVEASKRDDAAASFLLLPIHASERATPSILGVLPVPGVLPSQTVEIPSAWLAAAASAA